MITKAKEQTEKRERNQREPQWLTESRRNAWRIYESIPVPALKDEQWHHTDLSKLDFSRFTSNSIDQSIDKYAAESLKDQVSIDEAARASTDGHLSKLLDIFKSPSAVFCCAPAHQSISLSTEAKDKGVIVMDLAVACHEQPELVRRYLEILQVKLFDQDKFFILNAALFDEAVFLYVPPNVKLSDPLIFNFELSGDSFPKLVVIADQGSEFKLINMLSSASASFAAGVIQLAIGPNANVSYVELQNFHGQATVITRAVNQIGTNAQFNSLTVATGGSTIRSDILTELKGPGAEAKTLGIVLGSNNEHYDFNTIIDHQVPNTTSDINFRVALKDSSSSTYQGTIKVDKQAQGTVSYQSNKNLLLSDKAHASSIPKLEILANDVKCSHGATLAAVDKDQVFYLNSRGLNTTQAEQLIVSGFLNQVVESLKWPEITPWLELILSEKLLG